MSKNPTPKKIVLVLPLMDHGGGQRFITELANHWSSQQFEVTILLLRSGESFYPLSPNVKMKALGYSHEPGQSKITAIKSGVNTFFKLRKEIKRIDPIFVLSILSSTNIIVIAATRFLRTKIFVNDVMSPYRKRSKKEQKLRRLLYKKADGIIALTKVAKEIIFKETNSKNITVIPNPVKEVLIDESIKKEKLILNVGRLDSAKGQHYLIEAYAKLNRPEYKVAILGDGPKRKPLEELIEKLSLNEKVILPGPKSNIDEWLAKAEIFAFPSITESWGLALTESMAAGLPSVSFDCDVGPREMIVDGQNGFLIPVGDVDGLVEKLDFLIENPEVGKKLGQKAKKDAEKYKMETIGKEIFNFCTNNEYV